MEIAIIIFLVINSILLLFFLLKSSKGNNDELLLTKVNQLLLTNNGGMIKELGDFNHKLIVHQNHEFGLVRETLENSLYKIDKKVQDNLNEGFKKTHQTFNNVIERLAKIDEAQKKIDGLSHNVVSLQDILMDKKTRGIFGEVQLNQILRSVFGEKQGDIVTIQAVLSNQKIVDALLNLPEPLGRVPVDSKFPLENYKKMVDKTLDETHRLKAEKDFKINIKKHIDDIFDKYVSVPETSEQAIMFIPAEAIFAEIHAHHSDLIEYSQKKKVWLASPTTFMAILSTIQGILINVERSKYMSLMHAEINKLGQEFMRYQDRWDDLAKHIKTVGKDVEKIHTTSDKISKRFQGIMAVDVKNETDVKLESKI